MDSFISTLTPAQRVRLNSVISAPGRSAVVGAVPTQSESDPTTPEGYNDHWQGILTGLHSIYGRSDELHAALQNLTDQNHQDLARIESGIKELRDTLQAIRRANIRTLDWNGLFVESFGSSPHEDKSPSWFSTERREDESQTAVRSYIPATIDPDTRSLRLADGGDILRSNVAGDVRVALKVDRLLGVSRDTTHGLENLVDSRLDSYWMEEVDSPQPIVASPSVVRWLPTTYRQGCAARLHFRLPTTTLLSDFVLRPLSRNPLQVLQVAWANRLVSGVQYVVNSDFSAGSGGWTTNTPSGGTVTFSSGAAYDAGSCAVIQQLSGRTTLVATVFAVSGALQGLMFTAKLKTSGAIHCSLLLEWVNSSAAYSGHETYLIPTTSGEWQETSTLLLVPSGSIQGGSGTATFIVDGSGSCHATDLGLKPAECRNVLETLQLDASSLTVSMPGANATDVWVVVCQPHYDVVQASEETGDLAILLAQQAELDRRANRAPRDIWRVPEFLWRLQGGRRDGRVLDAPLGGSTPAEVAASRQSRLVRRLTASLRGLAEPPSHVVQRTMYRYLVGAWEAQLRLREYAPNGLWVSAPYYPRVEPRSLALITSPPLSDIQAEVRFWLMAREGDGLDRAKLLTDYNRESFGRATFQAAGETIISSGTTHFTLTPRYRKDEYRGTDPQGRLPLQFPPYINRETIKSLHLQLSSGTVIQPLTFDANQTIYYLATGSTYQKIPGYRPVKVWLNFQDGQVATPDTLGFPQPGDIAYVSGEVLQEVVSEESLTNNSGDAIVLPQAFLRRVDRMTARQPENRREAFRQNAMRDEIARRSALRVRQRRRQQSRTVSLTAVRTRFRPIAQGPNGVSMSLYWHKSSDTTSGGVTTSGDVLINPSRYLVDTESGVVTVFAAKPSGNTSYDSYVAYYYYEYDVYSREVRDERSASSQPSSGMDWYGPVQQRFPMTRNMTDYVRGTTPMLRPAVLDDLREDFYPVYEYWIDDRGVMRFAEPLHETGDNPATIVVEYDSLEIAPRIAIELLPRSNGYFSSYTPQIHDYTLVVNGR